MVALGAAVWVLSILSDKSPAYFLSGLGALMAILLIVFKDALLGFTAGVMISANDLVRNKDWIEIQSMGVDGEVFDVSLTTVKVRNWDNTIANVPAYALISAAFKNWRGMETSGGRRIKRAIRIDMQTVHFASEDEIARWRKIELLKPYLTRKLEEISAANARVPAEASGVPANVRMLTNLGTFRAYCMAYLKANKRIHQGMTMLVRQLERGHSVGHFRPPARRDFRVRPRAVSGAQRAQLRRRARPRRTFPPFAGFYIGNQMKTAASQKAWERMIAEKRSGKKR